MLVRGDGGDKFHHLLSLETMGTIISSGYLRYPECKLAVDGGEIPLDRYVVGDRSFGLIDTDALYAEYSKGATIVVHSVHRYWPPLSNFCFEMERLLSVPVHANAYLTPKGSQGFAVHYDAHDVFILQIAGRKHWRLYGSPVLLPDKRKPFDSSVTPIGRMRQSCTLRAGDLLYIPRGCLHDAVSRDEASLHITIGMKSTTWGDLLLEAIHILAQNDANLRKSLPAGFPDWDSTGASVQRKLLQLRSRVATNLPLAKALDEIADRFVHRRRPFLQGQLVDMERTGRLKLESTVAKRPEVLFRLWRQKNKVCILFFRKKILFPAFVGSALQFVANGETFHPREIPGGLTNASKLVLCRCLIKEGLLKILAE
jgi:bifunctional lysine-specific demethylase and histidyl-hydroxylase MINA